MNNRFDDEDNNSNEDNKDSFFRGLSGIAASTTFGIAQEITARTETLLLMRQLEALSYFNNIELVEKCTTNALDRYLKNANPVGRSIVRESLSKFPSKVVVDFASKGDTANASRQIFTEMVKIFDISPQQLKILRRAGMGSGVFLAGLGAYGIANADNPLDETGKVITSSGLSFGVGLAAGKLSIVPCGIFGPGAPVCVAGATLLGGGAASIWGTDWTWGKIKNFSNSVVPSAHADELILPLSHVPVVPYQSTTITKVSDYFEWETTMPEHWGLSSKFLFSVASGISTGLKNLGQTILHPYDRLIKPAGQLILDSCILNPAHMPGAIYGQSGADLRKSIEYQNAYNRMGQRIDGIEAIGFEFYNGNYEKKVEMLSSLATSMIAPPLFFRGAGMGLTAASNKFKFGNFKTPPLFHDTNKPNIFITQKKICLQNIEPSKFLADGFPVIQLPGTHTYLVHPRAILGNAGIIFESELGPKGLNFPPKASVADLRMPTRKRAELEIIYTISDEGALHLAKDTKYMGFGRYSGEQVALASSKPVIGAGRAVMKKGSLIKITPESDYYCSAPGHAELVEHVFYRHGFKEAQGKFFDSNNSFVQRANLRRGAKVLDISERVMHDIASQLGALPKEPIISYPKQAGLLNEPFAAGYGFAASLSGEKKSRSIVDKNKGLLSQSVDYSSSALSKTSILNSNVFLGTSLSSKSRRSITETLSFDRVSSKSSVSQRVVSLNNNNHSFSGTSFKLGSSNQPQLFDNKPSAEKKTSSLNANSVFHGAQLSAISIKPLPTLNLSSTPYSSQNGLLNNTLSFSGRSFKPTLAQFNSQGTDLTPAFKNTLSVPQSGFNNFSLTSASFNSTLTTSFNNVPLALSSSQSVGSLNKNISFQGTSCPSRLFSSPVANLTPKFKNTLSAPQGGLNNISLPGASFKPASVNQKLAFTEVKFGLKK